MSSPGGSFSYLSFHVGSDWTVRCTAYDGKAPILSVDAGSIAIAITPADRTNATEAAAEFARTLAHEAQAFAYEVERIRADRGAGNTADDGTEGGSSADEDAAASGTPAAGSEAA